MGHELTFSKVKSFSKTNLVDLAIEISYWCKENKTDITAISYTNTVIGSTEHFSALVVFATRE